VEELLAACRAHGQPITLNELQDIVAQNDKQRFAFSADAARLRANQGHSIEVELGYEPATPPRQLYHGTAQRFLASIRAQGLRKGRRHHVHLSAGQRHGQPVVLIVKAAEMQQNGFAFYLSTNGVWLTKHVPVTYLVF
jgi:putative RNA 2'-phosphotransferase